MSSTMLLKTLIFLNVHQRRKLQRVTLKQSEKRPSKCRVCNVAEGCISIFNNTLQPNISQDIKHFSGVDIQQSDKKSKYLCLSCLDLLNGCVKFRDMCRRSDQLLQYVEQSSAKYVTDPITLDGNDDRNDNASPEDAASASFLEDFNYEEHVWPCRTCKETFYDLESYKRHLPSCEAEKKKARLSVKHDRQKKGYLCDTCGKTLSSFQSFTFHRTTHKNVFPFKCASCPYRGRTKNLLVIHMRSHSEVKPYKCQYCPQTSTTASNLKRHVTHRHNNATRPHKCPYCIRSFIYEYELDRHVKQIHLGQDASECPVCQKKYSTRRVLRGHLRKVHKIRGEKGGRLPSYLSYERSQTEEHIEEEQETYEYI